jgi:hypothetical protein
VDPPPRRRDASPTAHRHLFGGGAEGALEAGDLLADSGRADRERLGRLAELQMFGNSDEVHELTELDTGHPKHTVTCCA